MQATARRASVLSSTLPARSACSFRQERWPTNTLHLNTAMKKPVIGVMLPVGFSVLAVLASAYGCEGITIMLFCIVLGLLSLGSLAIASLVDRRHTRSITIAGLTAAVVIASVAVWHWPLRVCYALSRPAFDALAARIRSGEQISVPTSAGLYTIRGAGLSSSGIPYLWTASGGGGSTGFVQTSPDHVHFNLWSVIHLDDRWQYISED